MPGRNYDPTQVRGKLSKAGIIFKDGIMYIPRELHLGIKTWGMVDYMNSIGVLWLRKKP